MGADASKRAIAPSFTPHTTRLAQDECSGAKVGSFHKNLQCSSDLQETAGGGPARPLRRSSQIGRTLMSLSEEMEKRTYLT
ncbi:hypothetical protein PIB30_008676 [Stylosanthes scabra]|uniref:Uncharacterized protein n=1 Tax=Stylosanthes scabra TaxID=79078 RepID=A0ABU6T5F7_9FABA|nr:hypothetical protein [Stylosanthes scabra]